MAKSCPRALLLTYVEPARLPPGLDTDLVVLVRVVGQYDKRILESFNPKHLAIYVGETNGRSAGETIDAFVQGGGTSVAVLHCSHADESLDDLDRYGVPSWIPYAKYYECECGAHRSLLALGMWLQVNSELPTLDEWFSCICPEQFRIRRDREGKKGC